MAEDGCARVDLVRPRESSATDPAGLTLPAIHQQLELEISRVSGPRFVVPDCGSIRPDGRGQDAADLAVKPAVIVRGQAAGRLRRIDAGREQRLVGVDISYAGQVMLIHDDLFDRL